jgi:hypothetical protein
VYACFGIFFISCLSKVTLILRHLWKTKFQGMLNPVHRLSLLYGDARFLRFCMKGIGLEKSLDILSKKRQEKSYQKAPIP